MNDLNSLTDESLPGRNERERPRGDVRAFSGRTKSMR